jgi:MFS family permease
LNKGPAILSPGEKSPGLYYGYIIVGACFLIMALSWGVQNSFGVFFKPMLNEFGWTRASTAGPYSLNTVISGLLSILAGRMSDRYGSRKVITAGAVILGAGYFLTSRITDLWHLYLIYGLLVAIGLSTMYVPLAAELTRWFIRRRGLMAGIGISGIGFGISIVPPLASHLIESFGWRTSLLTLGSGSIVLIIILAQFLRNHPMVPAVPGNPETKPENPVSERKEYSLREAAKSKKLWLIFVAWAFYGLFFQVGTVHIVPYATDQGMTAIMASTVLTVIGLIGIFGRMGLGFISDRLGIKAIVIIAFGFTGAAYLGLASFSHPWMLYLFAVFFGAFSGVGVLVTALVAEYFGFKALGAITGTIIFANTIGGAIGPVMAGNIFDNAGRYNPAFIICGLLAFIACLILLVLKPASRSRSEEIANLR